MKISQKDKSKRDFIKLSEIEKMTEGEVNNTIEPIPPEEVDQCKKYYAIARINGIISHGETEKDMSEGASILYVSENGLAFERIFHEVEGKWGKIPRVSFAEESEGKEAAEWMIDQLKNLISHHKKLDEQREPEIK